MQHISRNLFFLVFALLLVLLFEGRFTTQDDTSEEIPRGDGAAYGVRRIVDGDTVVLYKGSQEETVRLVGIDAPESEHAPGGPECYNEEATTRARELLTGTTVRFTYDTTQDTHDEYGRLLGYLTLYDGTDFGARMIEGGFAEEYTFKGSAYERQQAYKAAETQARSEVTGLWGCE